MKESTVPNDMALYYQTLERLKQKEIEIEELNDKLLIEQEKTDSFKQTLNQIVHNTVRSKPQSQDEMKKSLAFRMLLKSGFRTLRIYLGSWKRKCRLTKQKSMKSLTNKSV